MEHATRNFHAHGGNEWVVGGKLTFLPGATVEGAEGLFDIPKGADAQLPFIDDSTATTVAALREDYNALLAALRNVGKSVPCERRTVLPSQNREASGRRGVRRNRSAPPSAFPR